jgi:tetratricopeptide (TPR) repeat protein
MKIYETSLVDILIREDRKNYFFGSIEFDNKNYSKALSYFREAVIQRPTCGSYCKLATTYFRLKKYKDCVEAQKKAYELDNTHYHSYQMMLSCYAAQKDWSNAFTCFEFLSENMKNMNSDDDPMESYEQIFNELGVSLYIDKEYQKSLLVFKYLIDFTNSPNQWLYFACLGYCYYLVDDYNNSFYYNNRSLEIVKNPYAYKNLAHIELGRNNFEMAVKLYFMSAENFEQKDSFFGLINDDFEHIKSKGISREKIDLIFTLIKAENSV